MYHLNFGNGISWKVSIKKEMLNDNYCIIFAITILKYICSIDGLFTWGFILSDDRMEM